MTWLTALPPPFESLFLLLAVLLVKRVLQTIAAHNPWQFFQFFCYQLANKVNKVENGQSQQSISGFVAVVVTFTPLFVILWLFADFVAVPHLWQALLLYFALGSLTLVPTAKKIIKALSTGDNYKAKQTLKPLVLRETEQLSAMGLSKATIEVLIVKHMQLTVSVILIYLVAGPLAAVSYRLLLEMHYAWNPKRPNMATFGGFANALSQVLTWLPSRLFLLAGLLLSFGQQSTLLWRLTLPKFFQLNNDALIQFFAIALNIKLAGVAMYDGKKLRRTEFNSKGRAPDRNAVAQSYQFIGRINTLLVVLVISYYVLSWAASQTLT
ncbi:cobalamin biosynthesis protein CbiB [Thalassotalea euphylliae]|uniref:Cobalamin biosynthesis protein CbiB n=1 Tax=Thalassotalea euphylliae TaxID=1655234 RepID=A0A3E0TMG0_9GAMM|nr:cobalamin biosynthesis protein [Thalassotalea euphylliae]REL25537.1 cobalamin biosynthesis protein CbiB [Thalassotalea euphylliae]